MILAPRRFLIGAAAVCALAAPPAPANALERSVNGEIVAGVRWYPEDASLGRDFEWELGGELAIEVEGGAWRGLVKPRLRLDPLDGDRTRWIPTEAWLEGSARGVRVRAGRQVIRWGSADAFNPTDVLMRRDWGDDFADPEAPGEWALSAVYGAARFGVEVVFLPVLEGVDFPSSRSPWSLESAAKKALGFDPGPLGLIEDPRVPPGAREWTVAARVRMTRGSTDFYLVGVSGVDRSPVLTAVPAPGFNFAGLRPAATYLPLHLVGIEAQSAVGGVVLKGAVAYRDQSVADTTFSSEVFGDFGLAARSVQAAVGAEYLRLDLGGGPGSLLLSVELLFDDASRGDNLLFYRPLQKDLAFAATWTAGDFASTSIEAGWIQDLERAESAGTLRVRRRVAPRTMAEVGAEWILGPSGDVQSPFALFGANDRVRFRLVHGF